MSRRIGFGWLLVATGLGLAIAGVMNGELRAVFLKAAVICLECMGLR